MPKKARRVNTPTFDREPFFMGRLIHILKGILIIEKEEYSYEKY